ncbi:hypothetical protein ILYODFUR_012049 [Ilyodon furcidens]|uniref:Secreted protein n=1 Tax=Ilyodon furcidens TaxID=33524 RepID=A0ABV0SL75_9TELE
MLGDMRCLRYPRCFLSEEAGKSVALLLLLLVSSFQQQHASEGKKKKKKKRRRRRRRRDGKGDTLHGTSESPMIRSKDGGSAPTALRVYVRAFGSR